MLCASEDLNYEGGWPRVQVECARANNVHSRLSIFMKDVLKWQSETKVWRALGSPLGASLSLVRPSNRGIVLDMKRIISLVIYTNTSVLRVTRRSGIAAFRPAYCTVLHTCVKLPSLACRKMENVNGFRFRWVRARGHTSQKIDARPRVSKNKKFI